MYQTGVDGALHPPLDGRDPGKVFPIQLFVINENVRNSFPLWELVSRTWVRKGFLCSYSPQTIAERVEDSMVNKGSIPLQPTVFVGTVYFQG